MAKAKQSHEILYEARHEMALTQVIVAKKAGISTNTYARIERGEQQPTVSTLRKLSKVLNVSLSKLLEA
ncbi:MAG TPA: helix-turn-helix transcriptional regulator [Candidatus Saccharimonadales bacterium]|nr:helix-turn-helix transcriptional regulator [Candidatus Saccharimonadales bacterium]